MVLMGLDRVQKFTLPVNKEIGGRKGKSHVRTSESQEADLACFNTSQREMLTEFLEHSSY